ncbi:TRAP transporter large permease [Paenibacillus naphthalenovorans]|uniref:TRAP transporter large permease n=1 Tax=Paenibacillus naphthalenovorans TaxID=162209 RepID=UPI0008834E0C|nr:TRAP transporter large permease subunit [Paenibacillus naphthalenovorans]SDJ36893.1 C4-dicarboxylate transporter, DctM subunit [Paenibacillus naphthalenovorans]
MSATLFVSMLTLLALNVPLAIGIAFASIIAILFASDVPSFVAVQRIFTGLDSFTIMAIPFFVLAGKIMEKGGISQRLIGLAASIVGSTTGGLAIIAILASMFFAAISGSAPATVIAIGSIMVPAMVKAGYEKGFSIALMATAGTIGVIIPPSIPFITYGITANVSIGDLFIAGVIPGILIGISLMIYSYFYSKKHGYRGGEKTSFSKFFNQLRVSILGVLMPVIILGGIYGGIFTPTESGAIACVYGLIVSFFFYKELKLSDLKGLFVETGYISAMILLIMAAANIMSWILTAEQVPNKVAEIVGPYATDGIMLLIIINIILLILGTFLELNAAIIIVVPILLPLLAQFDINLVHFGVTMIVNMAIGLLTPPLGVNLFVAKTLGDISFNTIVRRVVPLLVVVLIDLILITFIPKISMFLLG